MFFFFFYSSCFVAEHTLRVYHRTRWSECCHYSYVYNSCDAVVSIVVSLCMLFRSSVGVGELKMTPSLIETIAPLHCQTVPSVVLSVSDCPVFAPGCEEQWHAERDPALSYEKQLFRVIELYENGVSSFVHLHGDSRVGIHVYLQAYVLRSISAFQLMVTMLDRGENKLGAIYYDYGAIIPHDTEHVSQH